MSLMLELMRVRGAMHAYNHHRYSMDVLKARALSLGHLWVEGSRPLV